MKRAGDLYGKVTDVANILDAARKAIRGKGCKHSIASLSYNMERVVFGIERDLKEHTYRPGRHHQFTARDKKARLISVPPVRDRVVHHALCNIIGPVLERSFIHHSYACRTGKGVHAAVRYARGCARKNGYYLKMDVASYFRSIDHEALYALICRKIKDHDALSLVRRIIEGAEAAPGKGLPIGNLTSQLFANLYLDPLDHFVKERLRMRLYLRYMDDMLLFGDSKEELFGALYEIASYLGEKLLLRLNHRVTLVGPVSAGIPFLGFRIFPGITMLSGQSKRRFMRRARARWRELAQGLASQEQYAGRMSSLVGFTQTANSRSLRRRYFAGGRQKAVPTA